MYRLLVQRLIGSSKGSSSLPLLKAKQQERASAFAFLTLVCVMAPTRGAAMARAHSTTSSSSGINTDTEGQAQKAPRRVPFSTDTEGQAQKAPRPVPFSPPKASFQRDDFFRLYQVFCNLTGQEFQVLHPHWQQQQQQGSQDWLVDTDSPSSSPWHSRQAKQTNN
jgi:hypothetical protein